MGKECKGMKKRVEKNSLSSGKELNGVFEE